MHCNKLNSDKIVGYRNTDFGIKSYTFENENGNEVTKHYCKHIVSNFGYQACYYCMIQRSLYESISEADQEIYDAHKFGYVSALARERYVTHIFK